MLSRACCHAHAGFFAFTCCCRGSRRSRLEPERGCVDLVDQTLKSEVTSQAAAAYGKRLAILPFSLFCSCSCCWTATQLVPFLLPLLLSALPLLRLLRLFLQIPHLRTDTYTSKMCLNMTVASSVQVIVEAGRARHRLLGARRLGTGWFSKT